MFKLILLFLVLFCVIILNPADVFIQKAEALSDVHIQNAEAFTDPVQKKRNLQAYVDLTYTPGSPGMFSYSIRYTGASYSEIKSMWLIRTLKVHLAYPTFYNIYTNWWIQINPIYNPWNNILIWDVPNTDFSVVVRVEDVYGNVARAGAMAKNY
ncbi:MAG: hypothetical protein KJ645_09905 [Planctomycetes bacterium]|nr:hypothetical protein [Planctomycetota bacterium]